MAMVAFLAFISATSVVGTLLIMLPFSAPRGPVYRHTGHIRSIQKQTFKVFFICLNLKKQRPWHAWSCSITAKAGFHRSDRVRVGDRERRNKSAYDLVNIKTIIISATESESEESERFHFLPTPPLTFRLWSSENQIAGVGKRSERIKQSQCTFPRFVIGLVFPLLLASSTIQFTLDRNDGVVSGITTLFSLDRKVLRFWLRLQLRLRR